MYTFDNVRVLCSSCEEDPKRPMSMSCNYQAPKPAVGTTLLFTDLRIYTRIINRFNIAGPLNYKMENFLKMLLFFWTLEKEISYFVRYSPTYFPIGNFASPQEFYSMENPQINQINIFPPSRKN